MVGEDEGRASERMVGKDEARKVSLMISGSQDLRRGRRARTVYRLVDESQRGWPPRLAFLFSPVAVTCDRYPLLESRTDSSLYSSSWVPSPNLLAFTTCSKLPVRCAYTRASRAHGSGVIGFRPRRFDGHERCMERSHLASRTAFSRARFSRDLARRRAAWVRCSLRASSSRMGR